MQPEAEAQQTASAGSGYLVNRAQEAIGPYIGILLMLGALIILFGVLQGEDFINWDSPKSILANNAILLILSVGLTFTLLVAGFDLSIAGVLAVSGILVGKMLTSGVPTYLAMVIVLVGGVIFGCLVTGFAIAKLDLNFFVVTLGVLLAARGVALALTNGESKSLFEYKSLNTLGTGAVDGWSYLGFIAIGIFIAAVLVMRYTGFGRMIYAVGGNTEAARLAGINVVWVRIAAYGICAGLAAFAGFLQDGYQTSANPDTLKGIELTAAAAVLVGGTSFVGGVGTMLGTFLGVAFIGTIKYGLILASSQINQYWADVITGGVLVISVGIDRYRRLRKSR
ncbi:MAG: ABC transporter permease [Actinobacteria bacterium]|nr:ABC transporter permease [Actinomycetota bacterium]